MKATRHPWLWLVVLASFLWLTACAGPAQEVSNPDPGFFLSLSRLVIDIDNEGLPSVGGVSADRLSQLTFGMVDLWWLRLDPAYVRWFTDVNLQHIEFVHREDGMLLYVNAAPLPTLTWDDDSLSAVQQVVSESGLFTPQVGQLIEMFIPFLQRLAVDVTVRFPLAAGAEVISLRDPTAQPEEIGAQVAETTPMLTMHLTLEYDAQGKVVVRPETAQALRALGVEVQQFALAPETIQGLVAANIQQMTVRKAGEGLFVLINDKPLPHITWNDENLANSAGLISQLFYTPEYAFTRQTVESVLPLLADMDGSVTLRLPEGGQ